MTGTLVTYLFQEHPSYNKCKACKHCRNKTREEVREVGPELICESVGKMIMRSSKIATDERPDIQLSRKLILIHRYLRTLPDSCSRGPCNRYKSKRLGHVRRISDLPSHAFYHANICIQHPIQRSAATRSQEELQISDCNLNEPSHQSPECS